MISSHQQSSMLTFVQSFQMPDKSSIRLDGHSFCDEHLDWNHPRRASYIDTSSLPVSGTQCSKLLAQNLKRVMLRGGPYQRGSAHDDTAL